MFKYLSSNYKNTDYSLFKYETNKNKGQFICKIHNQSYTQSLGSHKNGVKGCSKCAKNIMFYDDNTTQSLDMFGKVYFLRLKNNEEEFYKIGITSREDNKRINRFKKLYNVEILNIIESDIRDSYLLEQMILKNYKKYKYTPKIKFKGYSECFSKNPYYLYTEIIGSFYEDQAHNNQLHCEELGIDYEQQLIL